MIKAVNTFDPSKKIKLATYASRCIENEILMYFEETTKSELKCSFDEPLNVDWDGNELLLSDVMGTDGDIVYRSIEEQVDRSLLDDAIERSPRGKRKSLSLDTDLATEKKRRKKRLQICWEYLSPIYPGWKREL